LDVGAAADVAADLGDPRALGVVERLAVERGDLIAAREEVADEVDAEEAGTPGDEPAHVLAGYSAGRRVSTHRVAYHRRDEVRVRVRRADRGLPEEDGGPRAGQLRGAGGDRRATGGLCRAAGRIHGCPVPQHGP